MFKTKTVKIGENTNPRNLENTHWRNKPIRDYYDIFYLHNTGDNSVYLQQSERTHQSLSKGEAKGVERLHANYNFTSCNMSDVDKHIKEEFQRLVTNCTKDSDFFKVTSFLDEKELEQKDQQALILEPLSFGRLFWKSKCNTIQHAFENKCLKLFMALMNRISQEQAGTLLAENRFVQRALEPKSEKEKQLQAILAVYDEKELSIDIEELSLSEATKHKLQNSSWSDETVKRLYNKTKTFFIPRGQRKSKMHALSYYNTFETSLHHSTRAEAEKESSCMMTALKEEGFTIHQPLIDWTHKTLLEDLSEKMKSIKNECSVLFVCIMSHGDKGVLFDKDGFKVEINKVLNAMEGFPSHIPVVCLRTVHGII